MNSTVVDLSREELSNVDEDFESLLENEDIGIDYRKGKQKFSFYELFEQISEECTESVEGIAWDSAGGNIDDDFEALLNDEVTSISPQIQMKIFPTNEAERGLDRENIVGQYAGKDNEQETHSEKSVSKGFCQTFFSDYSEELLHNASDQDTKKRTTGMDSALLQEKKYRDECLAIKSLLVEERKSCQFQIKAKEKEINKLKTELEEIRNKVKESETDRDYTEEKKLNMLEKKRVDSPITAVREFGLNREEELVSQILILNERIKAQDDTIVKLQDDNIILRNKNQGVIDDMRNAVDEDSNQKIMLLQHELEDQKEVHKQLKAYVGEVLRNIMLTNPQMLERK